VNGRVQNPTYEVRGNAGILNVMWQALFSMDGNIFPQPMRRFTTPKVHLLDCHKDIIKEAEAN
jgi:hypothetical protein